MQNETLIAEEVNAEADGEKLIRVESTGSFKFALSLPGKDIGGKWLCRNDSDALAYKFYCTTSGTPRIFTWWTNGNGKEYLQDQEGNWLSWRIEANCLHMSASINAVPWKVEGDRLVRVNDGAVVSRPENQHWPLATAHFLMALPESEWALTVKVVEEPALASAA